MVIGPPGSQVGISLVVENFSPIVAVSHIKVRHIQVLQLNHPDYPSGICALDADIPKCAWSS